MRVRQVRRASLPSGWRHPHDQVRPRRTNEVPALPNETRNLLLYPSLRLRQPAQLSTRDGLRTNSYGPRDVYVAKPVSRKTPL